MDSDSEPEMFPYDPEIISNFMNPFNYQDPLATPTLSWAITFGTLGQVKSLLTASKNVNNPDNNGNVPVHLAVLSNRVDVLELLLEHSDINLNVTNYEGATPLILSLSHCQNENIIMNLLKAGADVHITNQMKESALHFSVRYPLITISHELIKRGADINAQDVNNYTPLIQAVECINLDAVSLLLYYNADVHLCCLHNLTPFMHSVIKHGCNEISLLLFEYYDDFSLETCDGWTVLILAARHRNPIAIDLVKCGADVNHFVSYTSTALYLSLFYPNARLFKEIWSKIDCDKIWQYNHDFLYAYHELCRFSNSEWVECTYLMLNSARGSDIFGFSLHISNPLNLCNGLWQWFKDYIRRNINLGDRLTILYIFLSLGYSVTFMDMICAYNFVGFKSELEVLLQHYSWSCRKQVFHKNHFVAYICGVEKSWSIKDIVTSLCRQMRTITDPDDTSCKIRMLESFGFFTIPYDERRHIDWGFFNKDIEEKILALPDVPSLTELSRNELRNCIRQNCKIRTAYQLQDIIKQLPVPQIIKDILRFKKPLYILNKP